MDTSKLYLVHCQLGVYGKKIIYTVAEKIVNSVYISLQLLNSLHIKAKLVQDKMHNISLPLQIAYTSTYCRFFGRNMHPREDI